MLHIKNLICCRPTYTIILCIICIICLQLGEDGECEGGDGMSGEADSEEVKRAKLLEVEAVRAAEGGSLGDGIGTTQPGCHCSTKLCFTLQQQSTGEREITSIWCCTKAHSHSQCYRLKIEWLQLVYNTKTFNGPGDKCSVLILQYLI